MKNRLYEFVTGIETGTQPDSGTPTDPNDIVTKSYVDGLIGTPKQEGFAGPGTLFTLTSTPRASANVNLYVNGVFQRQGTEYTIAGTGITMTQALVAGQVLDASYIF